METAPLKAFATSARTELIREVTARITAVLSQGSPERVENPTAVASLEKAVAGGGGGDKGKAHVADKVAYTWFNRIIALRFMDANGYTGIGVVAPAADQVGQPEVLAAAKRGQIDREVVSNNDIAAIAGLLNGSRQPRLGADAQAEAYALLLAAYCRFWHKTMPFMFERQGDFTELLIPANLLAGDSVLNRSVGVLDEDVCKDVEVIGWLYQFYISERHDEVFAGFKKNQKAGANEIPAATQLFTPHWIVRYLVENSLGRLWMLNHPASRLIEQMDYYIASVDEETDFPKIAGPEELKVIDPACGSGHLLTYAFDVLHAIYEEEGYAPSEIPSLILGNNLYGTEIDPRAGALAAFALTMKAVAKRKLFLKNPRQPNICVLETISFSSDELNFLATENGDRAREDAFWNAFNRADIFGSLLRPDIALLPGLTRVIEHAESSDLFASNILERARRVVHQATYLAPNYHILIANPPYMGSGNMGGPLSEFVKQTFPGDKQDLYACFVTRAFQLTRQKSFVAMVVGDTWMTLSTFEGFRTRLIEQGGLVNCLHLDDISNHPDVFGANTAFVLERGAAPNIHCTFVHLEPLGSRQKEENFLSAIHDPESPLIYRVATLVFRGIPGSAFAYRMGDAVRGVFERFPQLSDMADARQGLSPGDTARFVRYWFEVSQGKSATSMQDAESARNSGRKWFPLNKGGAFRRWYGNVDHVINWHNDGQEIRDFRPRSVIRNPKYYFRPAVTWSSVSSGESAFRSVDTGVIFSDVGQSIFADYATRARLLAVLNSRFGSDLLALLAPSLHFQAGTIAALPVCEDLDPNHATIVEQLIDIARRDWNTQETASGFERPDWINSSLDESLEKVVRSRREAWANCTDDVLEMESLLDVMVQKAYGLADHDHGNRIRSRVSLINNTSIGAGVEEEAEAVLAFERRSMAELISYAVGCMFGRYSLDEPGLILADPGATLQDYFAKVPIPSFVPDDDNVIPIVDGDWFEDDIMGRFRHFLRVAFGNKHFEENLSFVAESVGVKSLRDYFITKAGKSKFYDDHLHRYKKRPIYWLFSSPKGSFNALVYMHRYTPSTASTVLTYLREYVTKLESSLQQAERAGNAKEADRLRKILVELNEYEHDTLYPKASENVAIDLDDGVKVNYPKLGGALRKIVGLESSGD